MKTIHDEGIILREIPYQEENQIFRVLTKEHGIVQVLRKRGRRRAALAGPLMRVDVVYRQSEKSDLGICRELGVLDAYFRLREARESLETACSCVQAVVDSQFPGKPVPALYELLCRFLEAIPSIADPSVLGAAFRIKILKFEGMYSVPSLCTQCHQPLVARYFSNETAYCEKHRPSGALFFSSQEAEGMDVLAQSRSLDQVGRCRFPLDFVEKIESWYNFIFS